MSRGYIGNKKRLENYGRLFQYLNIYLYIYTIFQIIFEILISNQIVLVAPVVITSFKRISLFSYWLSLPKWIIGIVAILYVRIWQLWIVSVNSALNLRWIMRCDVWILSIIGGGAIYMSVAIILASSPCTEITCVILNTN